MSSQDLPATRATRSLYRARAPHGLLLILLGWVVVEIALITPAAAQIDDGGPLPKCPAPGTYAILPENCKLVVEKNWLAPPKPLWPLIAFAALTVAGVGASGYFALRIPEDQAHYDQVWLSVAGSNCCTDFSTNSKVQAAQNQITTDTQLMIFTGIAAGAGFVSGVLYYFLGPGKPDHQLVRQAMITPWISQGGNGVTVAGRF